MSAVEVRDGTATDGALAVLVSLDAPVRVAGVLIAALAAGQALQPLTGWLADRMGGRTLDVTGLLLSSLGGGLLSVAHSTWLLVVLLLLIGTGSGFFHPQALAGVRSLLHGEQQRIRWRRHARPLAILVSYRCVRALSIFAPVTYIPILWHQRGGSLVGGASIITTMIVVGVIGNLWGGHLADQAGRLPVLVVSALATAALIVSLVVVRGVWIWGVAAPLGIAVFLTASTTILVGQDIFPENRSMESGIALGLSNGVRALLVLLIGLWISDIDVTTVLVVIAGLSALSAPLALALPMSLRHADGGPTPAPVNARP